VSAGAGELVTAPAVPNGWHPPDGYSCWFYPGLTVLGPLCPEEFRSRRYAMERLAPLEGRRIVVWRLGRGFGAGPRIRWPEISWTRQVFQCGVGGVGAAGG